MGNLYFILILLIAWLSTHIRHEPSFLGVRRAGPTHGLMLICIRPYSKSFATCHRISSLSFGLIRYASLFHRLALGIRSIWCCISLMGGSPNGSSSEKSSLNSFKRGSTSVGITVSLTWMVDTRAYKSCLSSISCKKEDIDNREVLAAGLPSSVSDLGLTATNLFKGSLGSFIGARVILVWYLLSRNCKCYAIHHV